MDAEAGVALAEGAQMAVGKADAAVEVTVARLMVAAEGGSVGRIMVAAGGGKTVAGLMVAAEMGQLVGGWRGRRRRGRWRRGWGW